MNKFILFTVVFVTVGVSWLWPNFGYALPAEQAGFFQEAFSGIGSSLLAAGQTSSFALTSFGSALDRGVNAISDTAVSTQREAGIVIANTKTAIDRASESVLTAAEDIAAHVKAQISRQQARLAKEAAHKEITHYKSYVSSLAQEAKEDTLALLSSLRSSDSHNPTPPPLSLRGGDESNKTNSPLNLSPGERGEEGQNCLGQFCQGVTENVRYATNADNQPIKTRPPEQAFGRVIERIIVKETNQESRSANQENPIIRDSSFTLREQDPRINALITNLADLTNRVDERYGISQGGGSYSNAALFNMISQSQRIKTLDDVKITNATIEGYVTGTTLSNYLPLGGGHTHWRPHRNLSYALYHP